MVAVQHFVGKWDAGMATPKHTPQGRGYDTSLNYFEHKNDFWNSKSMQTSCGGTYDLWDTDHDNRVDWDEFIDSIVDEVMTASSSDPDDSFLSFGDFMQALAVTKADFREKMNIPFGKKETTAVQMKFSEGTFGAKEKS